MSLVRRFLQVAAIIATLVVGVAMMAVIVTQTTWFKGWLRTVVVRQAENYVNGTLSIGRLDGNLFSGILLEDVTVGMAGKPVVQLKDVGIDYSLWTLLSGDIVLNSIRLTKPVLRLERTATGWNLLELIKARTPTSQSNRRPIEIGEIGVSDATLHVEPQPVGTSGAAGAEAFVVPQEIDRLDASLGVKSSQDATVVTITHLSLRTHAPDLGVNALSGVVTQTADGIRFDKIALRTEESSIAAAGELTKLRSGAPVFNIHASSDKLTLGEIAKLVPILRDFQLQPAFEITATGPSDRLQVEVNAREQMVGEVIASLSVDAVAPGRHIAGTASLRHFNVGPVVKSATLRSDIVGETRFDLALAEGRLPMTGTYTVDASRVTIAGYDARNVKATGRIDGRTIRVRGSGNGYGARATAMGTVVVGGALRLDLRGQATHVDLRKMPSQLKIPAVPSLLAFEYTLTGRGPVFSGSAKMAGSTVADAAIAPGTVGTFRIGGGAPQYSAQGSVSGMDLQKVGRGFGIGLLTEDRFASLVNATFTMNGSGGGAHPLVLDADGVVTDSQVFGAGIPRMDLTTRIASGDMRVRAVGTFAGLDPKAISGNERHAGDLTGAIDVDTTIRQMASGVTLDTVDATGRVNLGRSNVGGLAFDSAVIDGRYAGREGQLNQLLVTGPDVNVSANGPIAFNDTGASNLTLHVETPVLEQIGELVGQPLSGAAVLDATVTGNGRELKAGGTLKGSNVARGAMKALTLDSTFTAVIPDLTVANATVEAESHGVFLEVGGQKINELTAKTKYAASNVEFDATAKTGARELAAAGSALFHTDHQEVHLGNLSLRTQNVEWRTEPGSKATIQYGNDRIVIDNIGLVSGDQRITARGVVGSATEALTVHAENVDVAQIDQLLLINHGMTGRLSADATVTGTTKEPQVDGTFALNTGAFRQFKFESVGGKVDYVKQGLKVDVRLQQTAEAWLTAKGYLPMALFSRKAPTEAVHTEHEAPPPGEAVDLQIASSQIGLGIIEGFTPYVTNVTGTLVANVHVTGSGSDPHLDGAVDIAGGGFEVPELGTSYTGLDTRVELTADRMNVREMRIVDEKRHVLTVGGSLAMHAGALGAVDIKVLSQEFEVMDNKAGDLDLDTNVHITGSLRKPRVEGTLNIRTGTIDVAEVLATATADPYSTEATVLGPPADASVPASPQVASVFDGLDLNLAVSVPSNLILRGRDIQPANASISVGDANITVGGLLSLRKPPGGKLSLLGEVNTVRGNYAFQGRRFDILRDGRVRFDGSDQIDPLLDLKASRVISGVTATVHIRGTMLEPELSFTSVPPLEEADVLSLIMFNQPANELGVGQQASLANSAASLAGGYLASGLAQSIAAVLPFDQVDIETSTSSGLGADVTIGQRVGDRVFVKLRQAFGAEQTTEFLLEYQLKDYLRLQTAVAETAGGAQRQMFRRVERGGIDLIFFFSF